MYINIKEENSVIVFAFRLRKKSHNFREVSDNDDFFFCHLDKYRL